MILQTMQVAQVTFISTSFLMLGLDDGTLLVAVYAEEPTFLTPRIICIFSRTEDDDIYSSVTVASLQDPFRGPISSSIPIPQHV